MLKLATLCGFLCGTRKAHPQYNNDSIKYIYINIKLIFQKRWTELLDLNIYYLLNKKSWNKQSVKW